MTGINQPTFIGMGKLSEDYVVEFHKKNGGVVAKLFHREVKVNQCLLEGLATTSWWAYITIPAFARYKVDQMRIGQENQIDPSRVTVQYYGKDKRVRSYNGSGSDEDMVDRPMPITIFNRAMSPLPLAMTVPCQNKNVKGSTLIELVHDRVLNLYYSIIQKHGVEQTANPFIQDSLAWFTTLGSWKGLMPSAEVHTRIKIESVKIFEENREFIISKDRLFLPAGFCIPCHNGIAWRLLSASDLSYSRIVEVIECIKKSYINVKDHDIAKWQLNALSRSAEIKLKAPLLCFMDYLNGLMFGMEASGLNAALATSLMTLDLILEGRLTYKLAFYANDDGGVYPYACFGNNQGTYKKREELLYHNRKECELSTPHSMSELRKNPSLSPVALKEAIIIKAWLKHHQIISSETVYNKQIDKIQYAINDLLFYYFFPELERSYMVNKFNKKLIYR